MIRVDCSEVKFLKSCARKHMYSSRNRMHLQPTIPNENLIFGTQFHEVLAMMYLETPLDKILEWIDREVTDPVKLRVMNAMATGYYDDPYQKDKKNYVVIDVEKGFCFPIDVVDGPLQCDFKYMLAPMNPDDANSATEWIAVDAYGAVHETICACGSIDMICIEVPTGRLVGFEHKTAKNFRPDVYDLVDEQPRLYTLALARILADYHAQGKYLEVQESGPIYLNQVKKLSSKFDYKRVSCSYTLEDLAAFRKDFANKAKAIATGACGDAPSPDFMKCQMCDYADLCAHYGYKEVKKEELLDEFEGEFEVRDHDHLDEKASRHNDDAD